MKYLNYHFENKYIISNIKSEIKQSYIIICANKCRDTVQYNFLVRFTTKITHPSGRFRK